jgi:adenine deaminase
MSKAIITGRLVDCSARETYPVELTVAGGRIAALRRLPGAEAAGWPFLLPGFVDAHVHVESSMLIPSEFGRLAVVHGTVASVSDPHEIANVCGRAGVDFMVAEGRRSPFKFHFGAPSCVPATAFETAGADLDAAAVEELLDRDDIHFLSEMMNFPGALHGDPEVMRKIVAAQRRGKPVDGHAPGLRGEEARRYAALGISTDHECFTREEALDKIAAGMRVIIREGSAARNFEALADLISEYPDRTMFCSDDKHPDSLVDGHIDRLCARAVARGIDPYDVIRTACLNPVEHYGLQVGRLREGDPADFILVDDLIGFRVRETWIDGICVARDGQSLVTTVPTTGGPAPETVNRFDCRPISPSDLRVPTHGMARYPFPVIGAVDGQLVTEKLDLQPARPGQEDAWVADPARDILKLAVVNRYQDAPVATAFIHRFGLRKGALASSVAHDSHNIVAVGTDDASIARAVNLVVAHRGGISCVTPDQEEVLPLPVGGLMSADDGYRVAAAYTRLDRAAKAAGSTLASPFMTLSFMALLVIPSLKLSDKGLFDGDGFRILGT